MSGRVAFKVLRLSNRVRAYSFAVELVSGSDMSFKIQFSHLLSSMGKLMWGYAGGQNDVCLGTLKWFESD